MTCLCGSGGEGLLFLSLGGLDEGWVQRSSTELLRLADFCGCSPWRFLREPLWGWQMCGASSAPVLCRPAGMPLDLEWHQVSVVRS